MTRFMPIVMLLLAVVLFSGCTGVKDDVRFRVDSELEPAESGFAVPDPTEVDLVEKMAYHRAEYRRALEELESFYSQKGYYTRNVWAKRELKSLDVQYRYLMPAEMAPATLQAVDEIAEADALYDKAMKLYKEATGILPDDNKLRNALKHFNKIIVDYPTSDKIDDCAYRAGQIYERFNDYEVAVVYYQRTFQWDEMTPYPARYRAARVMDWRLKMRQEALELYQLAIEREARYKDNTARATARVEQLKQVQPEELK